MRRLLIGLVLFGAVVSALGFMLSHESSGQTFITAPVERGTISTVVKATGSVDAVITVDVSSQLSGRISEVLVNFNDEVKTGQPIARVDPEIFAARVNEAKAVLKVAAANAELQKSAVRRTKAALENARTARKISEAQLAVAEVKQAEVERDFQRNARLASTSSVSDRELTQSRALRDAGAAGLRALEEDVTLKTQAIEIADAEVAMADANVQNAEAVVEQRQAALEQAELDLARTVIRAPIDGVIIKRDVNPGQTVAVTLEAKTLFKIAQDLREMEVRGKIDEADVGRLQVGQTTRFTVDAYPDRIFSGRVLQIRKSPEVVRLRKVELRPSVYAWDSDVIEPLVRTIGLWKYYRSGGSTISAVSNVSLSINRGEFVAIVGRSGSGKSTLMSLLGLLERADRGEYILNGRDAGSLPEDARATVRSREIGFVFQLPALLPRASALENVELPLGYAGVGAPERHRRASEALERVGLSARRDHWPHQLSGGEQQRVAIARAIVNSPALILADEPTGALDSKTSGEILSLFKNLHQEGRTIVVVTHAMDVAECAQRRITIHDGHIAHDDGDGNVRGSTTAVFPETVT